jgi:hypothetical protein
VREFRDSEGRPWQVALTVASAGRVRDLVRVAPPAVDGATAEPERPFDIIDAGRVAETFQILRTNYAAIGEALYAILLPKVQERGLTKEQFLDGLSGESLDAGARAIEEEIVDFFPPRLRGMVGALLRKMQELAEAVVARAEADVRAMPLPGMSSGPVPESSASIPESGPSGN